MWESLNKDRVFMVMANHLGELSTCDRKNVGAIITKSGRAISWGFNGAPPGLPHCEENNHGWAGWARVPEQEGCRNSTHAEANAVAFAARQGISTDGGTLYVTVFPCAVCARLLLAAGIKRVVFSEVYRNNDGYDLLKRGGIYTEHLPNEDPVPSVQS